MLAKDSARAERYARTGAELGNCSAMVTLATVFCKGTAEAVAWLEKAAKRGQPTAMLCLAKEYLRGSAVPIDVGKAATWAARAVALDGASDYIVKESALLLGAVYTEGVAGSPKDLQKGLHFFEKAAALGEAHAAFLVGNAYDFGEGRPTDRAKAAHWYKVGADQKHVLSTTCFGNALVMGSGVSRDVRAGMALLKTAAAAADGNFAFANFRLGEIYAGCELNGFGKFLQPRDRLVKQDPKLAVKHCSALFHRYLARPRSRRMPTGISRRRARRAAPTPAA